MNRKIVLLPCILILLLSCIEINVDFIKAVQGATSTLVGIQPYVIIGCVGDLFTINIVISDVADLMGWEFKLDYEGYTLNGTAFTEGPFLKSQGETSFSVLNFTDRYNLTCHRGMVWATCTKDEVPGVTGSGVLASVTFNVTGKYGHSSLNLCTMLINSDGQEISHTVKGGYFIGVSTACKIFVPLDYPTIQEAINYADDGDCIFIFSGRYYEHIVVNKLVTLVGEHPSNTIVDGNETGPAIQVVDVTEILDSTCVMLSQLMIQRSSHSGIFIENSLVGIVGCISRFNGENGVHLINSSCGIQFSDICNNTGHGVFANITNWLSIGPMNEIQNNGGYGVYSNHSTGLTVSENKIKNNHDGIFLRGSNNTISHNAIFLSEHCGLDMEFGTNNTIIHNYFINGDYGVRLLKSNNNTFYHNWFINNTQSVYTHESFNNTWDNGYEGNYWSHYNETEFDEFGIGYTPYVINENNRDNYPLMGPYMVADIYHDGKINYKDLFLLATSFGSTPTSPNWNPHADIYQDPYQERIDYLDLFILANDYGAKWEDISWDC